MRGGVPREPAKHQRLHSGFEIRHASFANPLQQAERLSNGEAAGWLWQFLLQGAGPDGWTGKAKRAAEAPGRRSGRGDQCGAGEDFIASGDMAGAIGDDDIAGAIGDMAGAMGDGDIAGAIGDMESDFMPEDSLAIGAGSLFGAQAAADNPSAIAAAPASQEVELSLKVMSGLSLMRRCAAGWLAGEFEIGVRA